MYGALASFLLVAMAFPLKNELLAYLGAMLFWLFILLALGRKFFRWLAR